MSLTSMEVEPSEVILSPPQPVSRTRSIGNGKHCHQCRQIREIVAQCNNQRNNYNRRCFVRICNKCLMNRYGEKVEEVATIEQWSCPKCRGICNCSICMKKRGHQPTGASINTAKAIGFSSVSEMLRNSATLTNNENNSSEMSAGLEKDIDFPPRNAGKLDADFQNLVENQQLGEDNSEMDEKSPKRSRKEWLDENANGLHHQVVECALPVGTDVKIVADVEMEGEDVGNAVQFIQFCSVFEKILDLKKGEAEYILEDVLKVQPVSRDQSSLTVQFHLRLLSIIQNDHGEKCTTYDSWFNALQKCLFESKHIPKELRLGLFEDISDYEALSARKKLRILNLLCDEVLGTQKLRNWIKPNLRVREKTKEAIQEHLLAEDNDTTTSHAKSEAAQADEQSHELNGMLLKCNQESGPLRIKPIFVDHRGRVYWNLNCNGKLDMMYQDVGNGDNTLTLDEKWFALDDEGKETIEKHVSSLRRK